jgi:hypothetical protein
MIAKLRPLAPLLLVLAALASMAQLNRVSMAQLVGTLPATKGGTGSTFFTVAGPTVARTYTFPDASATVAIVGANTGTVSFTGDISGVRGFFSGDVNVGGASSLYWSGRTIMQAPADKTWNLTDSTVATGYQITVGTPTLGTCTGGTIVSGSHNFGGQYSGNTSGSCIINFGAPAFTNTPYCVAMSIASTTHPRVSAASNASITVTGGVSGETITFLCQGRLGT